MALLLAQGLSLVEFLQDRLQGIALLQLLLRPGQGLLQQACALGSENGLRVKLEAADAIGIVAHRHHHAVEVRIDGQPGGHVAAHQRMIARHRQRVAQPGEHRLAVVFNV